MASLTLDWQTDFSKFMKLLNKDEMQDLFKIENVLEIADNARQLKNKYPTRAEPYFYLARLYRNIGEYEKSRIELNAIYNGMTIWQETPSWMLGCELLFEESLLAFYHEKNRKNALKYTITYLNHAECMNDIFAMENLYFFCEPLASRNNARAYRMNLPSLGCYHASSVNYMDLSGEDLLCIRYVNYNIDDNGMYDCTEFNTCNMIIYQNKMDIIENKIELPKYDTSFCGIEDIRLYREKSGKIRFVGTQQEWVREREVNKIMVGELDLVNKLLFNGSIIESPENAPCEKNWIPWINSHGDEYFIYWWGPFQLGQRVVETSQTLKIICNRDVPRIFGYFRGSSNIVYLASYDEYWTVVHFVHTPINGEGTRRYYHCLVKLKEDKSGLLHPISYTVPFTFLFSSGRRAIEYCMGFSVRNTHACFWISCMDSDPHRLDIELNELQGLEWMSV